VTSGFIMSQRTHFWLRVVGLAVILAAQFGPRLWTNAAGPTPANAAVAAALR
jgi:hypothetical protein